MQRNFLILILGLFLTFSCDEKFNCEEFTLGTPFVVKAGEINQDCPGQLSITLVRVENDSRCPSNANCVWAGNAEVVFIFRNVDEETEFTLDTNASMQGSENEKEVLGYSIKLNGLTPYPEISMQIKEKDYRADITITKVI
jgi:hypothetical protein